MRRPTDSSGWLDTTPRLGQIQVPDEVYERLKDDFVLRERGHINVKGKA